MDVLGTCKFCQKSVPADILAEASQYSFWTKPDGACPACIQETLLYTLLGKGDSALHEQIQDVWPLDAAAAFGALPTALRLHADPRFTGQGVTIAMLDSDFYPHPDLIRPSNRIRAWVDVTTDPVTVLTFQPDEDPQWPGWADQSGSQWHGTMTAVTAAGNGYLSHGLYSGMARDAELVLVRVRDETGIHNPTIERALRWVAENAASLNILVVNMSFGGDAVADLWDNPVDTAVADLVAQGITVTAAAGNDGVRWLVPPATAPEGLTIGGLDDRNTFVHEDDVAWHSNYGSGVDAAFKPELVAPRIWLAAPILPETAVAWEAKFLFHYRGYGPIEERIWQLKLITPHYQHVDGTSFAAPLVASTVACMLEANPDLTPPLIRQILQQTATPIPNVSQERQGAGALTPGTAVAAALLHKHSSLDDWISIPSISADEITFLLHDHSASRVRLLGSWDGWQSTPDAEQIEEGVWRLVIPRLANGRYAYKYLRDENDWLDDPVNPRKVWDGYSGFNSLLYVED